jgi:AraC-like DNA-binding protein
VADVAVLPGAQSLVHVPDPATALVFRTTVARHSDLMVVGPRTRASYYGGKDFPLCLRIRLRPGAARPLLGVPLRELVDRVVPLADLWEDSTGLPYRLASLGPDPRLVLRHLEAALLARIAAQTAEDLARGELVATAAEALAVRQQPLPALARRLAVSERHLRDLFTDGVGLAPKRFARISRLRGVLDSGRTRAVGWSHLAAATGYYDQSHMTAEFRAMMGVPPTAFFAGRLPSLQSC